MKQQLIKAVLILTLMAPTHHGWAGTGADAAQAVIKNTIDQVLKEPDKLNEAAWVDNLIDQVFDFERMSKFVLGPNWKKASPDQQTAFVKEFRALLVRTYSTSLKKSIAAGKKFEVTYLPNAGGEERPKIKTIVKETDKAPMAVDYDMYSLKGVWKAYNVTVEGVSLVTNYQNEFEKDIREKGMDGLISKLQTRNQSSEEPSVPLSPQGGK
jgi:phospholipid transport system substrate-binding protein